MGKLWVWDSDDKMWVRIKDGIRISDTDLRQYEKDNHSSIRGVTGDDRLEGCLATLAPAVSAQPSADAVSVDAGEQPSDIQGIDGDILANPMLREALGLDTQADGYKAPTDCCMVCGRQPHDGECQIC